MQCNSANPAGSSSRQNETEDGNRDQQRSRLTSLIGRLLARHWLRQQSRDDHLAEAATPGPQSTMPSSQLDQEAIENT